LSRDAGSDCQQQQCNLSQSSLSHVAQGQSKQWQTLEKVSDAEHGAKMKMLLVPACGLVLALAA